MSPPCLHRYLLSARFEGLVHFLEPLLRPIQETAKQGDEKTGESLALSKARVIAIKRLELE